MLIYRAKSSIPEPISKFKPVQTVLNELRHFIVTNDKDIFSKIDDKIDDLKWLERDDYEIAILNYELNPDDIAKKEQIINFKCKLGKHNWAIPLLRAFPEGVTLPSNLYWNLDGSKIVVVEPEYLNACLLGDEIFNELENIKDKGDFDTVADWLYRILLVNYKITKDDVEMHGLVNTKRWIDPLYMSIDGNSITKFLQSNDEEKKTFLKERCIPESFINTFLQLQNG